MATVNPPPIPVPRQFASDRELNDYFQRLHKVIFQLWALASGGTGGSGSGGDTFITNVTEGDTIQEFFGGAGLAQFASLLDRVDSIDIDLIAINGRLLAHIGALYQEFQTMPSSPKVFALNDIITSITDASPDLLRSQTSGVGQISQATAYNTTASAVKLSLYILGAGIEAADVAPVWEQSIAANASAILSGLLGHNIPQGGSLQAIADTADAVVVSVSGSDSV